MKRATQTPIAYALQLVSRRAYSEAELTTKLKSKAFNPQEIEKTIARLKVLHYIDDHQYIKNFIHYQKLRGKGPFWIQQSLLQKGLGQSQVEGLIHEEDWRCACFEQLQKQLNTIKNRVYEAEPQSTTLDATEAREKISRQQQAKIIRHLLSRGFAYGDIMDCFSNLDDYKHQIHDY